jgi:hypothetical protein
MSTLTTSNSMNHIHASNNQYASNHTNSKDARNKKFTKTFDLSQIAEDPMDTYLDSLGLWKKRIARDGSCLFRAVAEQVFNFLIYLFFSSLTKSSNSFNFYLNSTRFIRVRPITRKLD